DAGADSGQRRQPRRHLHPEPRQPPPLNVEHDLVWQESDPYQYRFTKIVDPDKPSEVLFEIEHEVRSLTHPMYLRPLINRNPAQRQRTYVRGRDAFVG